MAMILVKTLQGVEYNLYIITKLNRERDNGLKIIFNQKAYQSQGHFNDNFLPIIALSPVITDENALIAINALLQSNMTAAVSATEQYLIGAVEYYEGGEIVG